MRLFDLLLLMTLSGSAAAQDVIRLTNDREKAGFLFGSAHNAVAGVPENRSILLDPIQQSSIIALETAEGLSLEFRRTHLGLKEGATIFDVLPKRVHPCLRKALADLTSAPTIAPGVASLIELSPPLFALTYVGFVLNIGGGPQTGVGYDRLIAAEAVARNKTVVSLESPMDKVDFIKRVSEADAINLLEGACLTHGSPELRREVSALVRRMVAYYLTNDHDRLTETHRQIYRMLGASEAFVRAFWEDRNERMARKIAGMVSNGYTPFVAVGASHLGGRDGILALLARSGISGQSLRKER